MLRLLQMTTGEGSGELEQLAAQNASQPEDARTEQQDAAGLRNRAASRRGRLRGRAAQDRERFRRNRSDRVLRSRRRTGVLIPVNRVASIDNRVLQVQPVGAGRQVDGAEAAGAGLGADVEAVLVARASALGEVDNRVIERGAAEFGRGDGDLGRLKHVARIRPRTKLQTGSRALAAQREAVADDETGVDGPGIRCAVDGTVAIEVLRHGRNRNQAQRKQ